MSSSVSAGAADTAPRLYTQAMRTILVAGLALALAGCSLVTLDFTPRIRPLQERTVEGAGGAKILLTDVSGFLSDEGPSPGLVIGTPPPRVPMLVRLREELKKAADDPDVRALVLRINSPGGTVTASDIIWREIDGWKRSTWRLRAATTSRSPPTRSSPTRRRSRARSAW